MTQERRQSLLQWIKKMFRIHSAWVSFAIGGMVGTGKVLAKVNECYVNIMVAIQKGVIDKETMQRELSETKAELTTLKSECKETHMRQDDKIERYIVNR